MLRFFRKKKLTPIDDQIERILDQMRQIGVGSDEYPKLMTYLERLYEVKADERRNPVSRDTVALIAGNLMGILLIIAYEQKHIMSSKGFSQIIRPK